MSDIGTLTAVQRDHALDHQIYQDLRERLVDRSRRNRLLNFKHTSKGAMLRIVNEVPDLVLAKLRNESKLRFKPLPDPDDDEPAEERTQQFRSALVGARATEEEYRRAIAALDPEDPSANAKEERLERALRNRVRTQLGLPTRVQSQGTDPAAHARTYGIDPSFELPTPSASLPVKRADDWMQTLLFPDQLKKRVAGIARKVREVEQETGVATLHLAFGFFEWFESESSDSAYSSPLLLLSVSLERHRARPGEDDYRLVALDEPPSTNLSLEVRLRDDFGLTLPAYGGSDHPIEEYLQSVLMATKSMKRCRVRRYVTLAPFSFARIAMYRDLDPANWTGIAGSAPGHPLVKPLLRGRGEEPIGSDGFSNEYEIDRPEISDLAPILVCDADSSQHSAIIDVMKGRTLVIEGPPGTGKSQTIANLIANALHAGKRVLFVAEKMAALNVVKERLETVGLGEFCLALHTAGAKPEAVIDALRKREAMLPPRLSSAAIVSDLQARRARDEIQSHLNTLHAEAGPLGETVHAYIGRLAELARNLPRLPALLRGCARDLPPVLSQTSLSEAQRRLESLETAARAATAAGVDITNSPFKALDRTDLLPDERESLMRGLGRLVTACVEQQLTAKTLENWLPRQTSDTSVAAIQESAVEVQNVPDPPVEVNRSQLRTLVTKQAMDDALWVAQQNEQLDCALTRLHAANIGNPALLHVDAVIAAIEFGDSLGIAGFSIDQVISRAREAEQEARAWDASSRTVEALVRLWGLSLEPDIGVVRLACIATQLASDVDDAWYRFCRPGLERHVAELEAGASRQEALETSLREVSARIDIENVSHVTLRTAADTLRSAGPLSFLRGDVREAKRLFSQIWRGGSHPRATRWAAELYSAAAVLAERAAFESNPKLLAIVGSQHNIVTTPLRQLARASRWQSKLLCLLSTDKLDAAGLSTKLIRLNAEQMEQLRGLAAPARALLDFLAQQALTAEAKWSAPRGCAVARAAALDTLGKGLDASGLPSDTLVSEFKAILAAHAEWLAAAKALASERAEPFGGSASAENLRATVAFVQDIWSRYSDLGLFLLADGWTERITALRRLGLDAKKAVETTSGILLELEDAGLSTFAGVARHQDADAVQRTASDMLAAGQTLSAYLEFATTRFSCLDHPLASIVLAAFEDGEERLQHLPEALDWLVAWTIVRRSAEVNRPVFNRTGDQLTMNRKHFAAADRTRLSHDARRVQRSVLARPIPAGSSFGSRKEWTDRSLLENEMVKQRRHIPVRDLLDRAGNAVLALTPCLMMSPLTVAQYLRPTGMVFDLVIMDEASQIKPEDSLGAMLRGRQAVIVGDPKQLPPTNFFDRAIEDVEDDESSDDDNGPHLSSEDRVAAESVLDLALRAFRPARRLRWHYRSQHESLIAFSNREFYNSDLVVFPSSAAPSDTLGIELVRVRGRWRERINQEEAQAVVGAAVDFMRRHPTLSLGIVAMNQPQRDLIRAELDLHVADDGALARYVEYWEESSGSLFVKNLENVQGDERDVIFISLGWGRTPEGALHQRFHPVSRRQDGHRRLNVLFTRARRKIVLFSSLAPEDIVVDPERSAPGVRILRDYLTYAYDGRLEQGTDEGAEADSPFETSVANALRELGHNVALQVGVAGYRVDLAVRHPVDQTRFILGIECDGATYHSAKSARDRDRLRQEALERLGWTLIRVWSTDWFRDPSAQTQKLSSAINDALSKTVLEQSLRRRLVELVDSEPFPPAPLTAPHTAKRRKTANLISEPPPPISSDLEEPSPSVAPQAPTLTDALRAFRDDVIMRDFPGSEPGRCILREAIIEIIVRTGLDEPEEFHHKIPEYLRSRTDGRQVAYLPTICDLVDQHKMRA
jgi:very-short-patch-repair endonuclease